MAKKEKIIMKARCTRVGPCWYRNSCKKKKERKGIATLFFLCLEFLVSTKTPHFAALMKPCNEGRTRL